MINQSIQVKKGSLTEEELNSLGQQIIIKRFKNRKLYIASTYRARIASYINCYDIVTIIKLGKQIKIVDINYKDITNKVFKSLASQAYLYNDKSSVNESIEMLVRYV